MGLVHAVPWGLLPVFPVFVEKIEGRRQMGHHNIDMVTGRSLDILMEHAQPLHGFHHGTRTAHRNREIGGAMYHELRDALRFFHCTP